MLPVTVAPPAESERAITRIFREIAQKYSLQLTMLSHNWIVTFTNPPTKKQAGVFGYKFDINGAAAQSKCDDKVATAETLIDKKVPAIPHKIFLSDSKVDMVDPSGSMNQIYKYTAKFNHDVVCKPVSDSGGRDVQHVKNILQLNSAVTTLFAKSPTLCISPYRSFTHEYRIIMLDGEPQLAFKKIKPHLVGDGSTSVFDLYFEWARTHQASFKKIDQSSLPMDNVLKKGEILELGWKHNLCNGATAELLSLHKRKITPLSPKSCPLSSAMPEEAKLMIITTIAKNAVEALGIRFCSVDIAEISEAQFEVVEVNSGVMMENLIKQYGLPVYDKAKKIYEKVICRMLDISFIESEDSEEETSPMALAMHGKFNFSVSSTTTHLIDSASNLRSRPEDEGKR